MLYKLVYDVQPYVPFSNTIIIIIINIIIITIIIIPPGLVSAPTGFKMSEMQRSDTFFIVLTNISPELEYFYQVVRFTGGREE